jgi:hypothetical protein
MGHQYHTSVSGACQTSRLHFGQAQRKHRVYVNAELAPSLLLLPAGLLLLLLLRTCLVNHQLPCCDLPTPPHHQLGRKASSLLLLQMRLR